MVVVPWAVTKKNHQWLTVGNIFNQTLSRKSYS